MPIASLLTPGGRGAVATIRVVDGNALMDPVNSPLFAAANRKRLQDQPVGHVCFGHWGREVPEEVVLCRTSDSSTEIHCHGGVTAARRILDDLQEAGCRVATWQEMEVQLAGVFESEMSVAMSQAVTLRTAEFLLRQQNGLLPSAIEQLADASWDEAGRKRIRQRLDDFLRWSQFGLHLSEPWQVVLGGRPNVGKSSLTNVLLGYSRSIVFDQPGTTRDVVTATAAFDGWPVELADTAGIRKGADELESAGIDLANERFQNADCRVLLLDISGPPTADDTALIGQWPDALVVAHKCDLPDCWGEELPIRALRVSSLSSEGVEELISAIVGHLVPEVPGGDVPLLVTPRQVDLIETANAAVVQNREEDFRAALHELLSSSSYPLPSGEGGRRPGEGQK